jgi:P27 family predicted phage terminase small subunit
MSKAGRPLVPAVIKELSGTIRKDRTRETIQFDLITEVPKPEVWLTNKAKKYFKNMCELLISKKLLNVANVQLVVIMAEEFATYEEATRELKSSPAKGEQKKKDGKVFKTDKGYQASSPWISIRNQAQKNYRDIAALFGLDPLSCQKIGATSKGDEDEFDKMQKKYNE